MKPSWSERNSFEKAVFVVQGLCALVLIAFMCVGLFSGKGLSDSLYLLVAIESLLEVAVQWRHSRKTALLSLLVAVSSLAVFFQTAL